MKKVITYGTYDLLHHGHIRLLERAKALGDYLIVGVTTEDFDKVRGKVNVKQSLMERVEAVKATGFADEVIIEEYEGQKIDDIKRYDIDVFTVGSDWEGFFDYLKEYCEVVYLDRTEGVSSSDIRANRSRLKLGFIGNSSVVLKYIREARLVNGIEPVCLLGKKDSVLCAAAGEHELAIVNSLDSLFALVDAVYICSHPEEHVYQIERAMRAGKHVLCEAPIALSVVAHDHLQELANDEGVVLMEALKTAYLTAYHRLKLLVKGGRIGEIVSVDATCTSLRSGQSRNEQVQEWNSICAWGPTALLPALQLLGTDYVESVIVSRIEDEATAFDSFTNINLYYMDAVADIKVGKGVKSEGELVISGTKGYVYVPAPWWKTEYFEVRYEDPVENRRYFYQANGEGIRYELVCFQKQIESGPNDIYLDPSISRATIGIIEQFYAGDMKRLKCLE